MMDTSPDSNACSVWEPANKLGIPQSARDVFQLLAQSEMINPALAEPLQHMVGFRHIAAHAYLALQLLVIINIIENHLDEFLQYSRAGC